MTFAQQIERTRKELGMTQAEMARVLGVGKRTLETWEEGSAVPHLLSQEGAWARIHKLKASEPSVCTKQN